MRITKFGHSCLLVEENKARILIDPGSYSTLQNDAKNVDAILITHEHSDHFSLDSLKKVLANNPKARIFTNPSVGKKLVEANIFFDILGNGQGITVNDVLIEGMGEKHAFIYHTLPICENVGYLIANRFLCPGDTFELPNRPIEILACPIAAPWAKLAETLDYGKAIKPKIIFPVHDGFLKSANPYYPHAEREFKAVGIEWRIIGEGESIEV